MSLSWLRRFAALAVGLLCCAPAWAHGSPVGVKAVWDGALHLLTSPLSLAALVGVSVVLTGVRERLIFALALSAALSAGAAVLISSDLPAYATPAVIAAVGLMGVGAWRPSETFAFAIAAFAGLAGGLAADLHSPSMQTIAGVFLAEFFILAGVLTAYFHIASMQKLVGVLPIAKRVLGSWVAAIGLLMTTLALQMGKQ